MFYPGLSNVEQIINAFNRRHNADIVIINRGQLEFALEKPRMSIYGHELYPELHQKAAVLMEAITKSHTLSDGNKRTAMAVADFMISKNGGQLILPLKAIRLSVDAAMDESDAMSGVIQAWFKVHTAMNDGQLHFMMGELVEEESVVRNMIHDGRSNDAENIVSQWMAFDSYPEHKKRWDELNGRWEQDMRIADSRSRSGDIASKWQKTWRALNTTRHAPDSEHAGNQDIREIGDMLWRDNSYETVSRIEARMDGLGQT